MLGSEEPRGRSDAAQREPPRSPAAWRPSIPTSTTRSRGAVPRRSRRARGAGTVPLAPRARRRPDAPRRPARRAGRALAVFPLDPAHARSLHAYPLELYWFSDGLWVIDAADRDLASASRPSTACRWRTSIARVRPLVPRDNESTCGCGCRRTVVSEEVLAGVGIGDGGAARFEFAGGRGGAARARDERRLRLAVRLRVALGLAAERRAAAWLQRPGDGAMAAHDRPRPRRLPRLPPRDDDARTTAQRLIRLASVALGAARDRRRAPERRRRQHEYGALVGALIRPSIGRKAFVLTGRVTFSAAGNFVAEVEERRGPASSASLPAARRTSGATGPCSPCRSPGLAGGVANQYVQVIRAGDVRSTIRPDVRVDLGVVGLLRRPRSRAGARALALPPGNVRARWRAPFLPSTTFAA